MATARTLCAAALRKIGVVSSGRPMSSDEGADALEELNRKIDQWATERLTIYQITRSTWTITSGTGVYTVGSGGDVHIARPIYIDRVGYQDTSTSPSTEYNLTRLTDQAFYAISQKGRTSARPSAWYYNPTYATGTLTFDPYPTDTTLEGVIYHPTAVTSFAGLSTAVTLPPSYEQFLVTHLAIALCPEYERQPHPVLIREAMKAEKDLKRANFRMHDLSFEPSALVSRYRWGYDINTDA